MSASLSEDVGKGSQKGLGSFAGTQAEQGQTASLEGCRACYWNCHTELNLTLSRLGGER